MARSRGIPSVIRLAGSCAVAVGVLALAGCKAAPAQKPADWSITPAYDKTGRLESITYDRNHDGKPDAWLKMHGAVVVSADLDEDYDGKVDRREIYAEGAAGATGSGAPASGSALPARNEVVRVEQSTRGDGTMNRIEFYEHGTLARVEEDTNGDGRVDKWDTWANGSLVMTALDTKATGKPDRRIIYPEVGEPRMEVDTKGDGTFTPLVH